MEKVLINVEKILVFSDYGHWKNRSPEWKKENGQEGYTLICIDNEGYVCNLEKDFVRAEKINRFPVIAFRVIKSRYI